MLHASMICNPVMALTMVFIMVVKPSAIASFSLLLVAPVVAIASVLGGRGGRREHRSCHGGLTQL